MQFEPKLRTFFLLLALLFAGLAAFIAYGRRTNFPSNIVEDKKSGEWHNTFFNSTGNPNLKDISAPFYADPPIYGNMLPQHGAHGEGDHKENAHQDEHEHTEAKDKATDHNDSHNTEIELPSSNKAE